MTGKPEPGYPLLVEAELIIGGEALGKSMAHFARPRGRDLLGRTRTYLAWQQTRRTQGLWPFSRALMTAAATECEIMDDAGRTAAGLNFASQDYLSLSRHPNVIKSAVEALREFGVHSAGSAVLLGNTRLSLDLERALADYLQTEHVVLFPTGWGAGYGAIKGLVRPDDHVVLDALSHACLQEGAAAATSRVKRFRHLAVDDLRRQLSAIRSKDSANGILVVTEGLFSMDSDKPDLVATQGVCQEFAATLLVDVAHDLGSSGPAGTGTLGLQTMLGKVDLVMGSFSKTFASNGGFVATNSRAVKEYLQAAAGPYTFSNALSPVQAATVMKCLEIVQSTEGDKRRAALADNIAALRTTLEDHGIPCLGEESPIVPAVAGSEKIARVASRFATEAGVLVNLVEFPAVPVGRARFRLQVMARHTQSEARQAGVTISNAISQARAFFEQNREPVALGPTITPLVKA